MCMCIYIHIHIQVYVYIREKLNRYTYTYKCVCVCVCVYVCMCICVIPFGITVDFESIEDNTVTLRERDSMNQIRLLASEAASVVSDMVRGKVMWDDIKC
eukprot:GHVR01129627.1.p1 GENE.GHVR01129627.1~~GHVR01129627.1.p1  ORF type:complete len:100 (+),score=34.50 GHVR01129627.1:622-921(+)